jgi:Cft2 family RNA processing exonuclease
MHEDHLRGLMNDYHAKDKGPDTKWSNGKIYCSHVTYRLMMLRFEHLRPYVQPIDMDKFYEVDRLSEY